MKNYKTIAQSTNDGLNEIIGMTEGLLDKPFSIMEFFGFTKYSTTEFMFSADTASYADEAVIQHGLGEIPKMGMIKSVEDVTAYGYPRYIIGAAFMFNSGSFTTTTFNGSNFTVYDDDRPFSNPEGALLTLTAETYKSNQSQFKAGVHYNMIVFA